MKQLFETISIKTNEIHESSKKMADLKKEIISNVNEQLAKLNTPNRGKEAVETDNSPTEYNPAIIRKLNMKVNYDVFESITAKKADKSYVDQIIGLAFESQKQQKLLLSIISEVLRVMLIKQDDAIHTKQKKITILL